MPFRIFVVILFLFNLNIKYNIMKTNILALLLIVIFAAPSMAQDNKTVRIPTLGEVAP
ncbi:MAG: hypothetical protein BWY70_00142 [Bacteroidetes bacterium ADurb.Bin408]|nr:MAG: hypothetical protein BWY70_00142 [Bacteroidetes bacterium ADurb.Bin408]